MKRDFVFGTLAYSITTLAIAVPWHFVLFKELYHSLGIYNRTEPIVPLGILSMLVQGGIMAWLYPKAYPGRSSLRNALAYSWGMGLFLFSVSTLANAAKINVSSMSSWLAIQSAFHFLQFSIVGVAFAWVYKDSNGL